MANALRLLPLIKSSRQRTAVSTVPCRPIIFPSHTRAHHIYLATILTHNAKPNVQNVHTETFGESYIQFSENALHYNRAPGGKQFIYCLCLFLFANCSKCVVPQCHISSPNQNHVQDTARSIHATTRFCL